MEMMLVHNLLLVISICFLQISPGLCTDPCINYVSLKDQFHRSVAFPVDLMDSPKCDSTLSEGWFRIESKSGSDMITTCPPINRCGTYYPLWLNGSLPSETDGIVSRAVCLSALKGCCEAEIQIQIKNCGNYTVYYLKQSPGCPQVYCFGTEFITTTTTTTTTTTIATTAAETIVYHIELHKNDNIWIIVACVVSFVGVLILVIIYVRQHQDPKVNSEKKEDSPPPPYPGKLESHMEKNAVVVEEKTHLRSCIRYGQPTFSTHEEKKCHLPSD